MSSKLNDLLYFARNCFEGYPYNQGKDPGYFEHLLDEFSELDLMYEIKLYYAWTLDLMDNRSFPYRMLFQLWLIHSRTFGGVETSTFYEKVGQC